MSSASPFARPRAHRNVQGIAAALLPLEADGRMAVDAFQKHLPADGSQFAFLAKPFTLKQLVAAVKETLVA